MKRQRLTWERLVAQLPLAPEESEPPPYGFATRVAGQWRALRRDESLRLWTHWSFRSALASAAACALLVLVQTRHDDAILVPLPEPPTPACLPTSP